MKIASLIFTVLSIFTHQSLAFSRGAGLCSDNLQAMAQGMGGSNNAGLGWILTASATSYTPGQPLEISISGGNGGFYKGLLLYAQDGSGKHVGTFNSLPGGYQTLDEQCANEGGPKSTLSHSNNAAKSSGKFTWTAPASAVGSIQFRGIIVGDSMSRWMAFSPLSVNADGTDGDDGGGGGGNDENGDGSDGGTGDIGGSLTTSTPAAVPTGQAGTDGDNSQGGGASLTSVNGKRCKPRKPSSSPPPASYGDNKGCKRRRNQRRR